MLIAIAYVAAGLAMLYFGGEALVRGASNLALRLGISAVAIGLTVVAFGTSAPELVVSVDAALTGANDISVGNVVGSNIANIALILGIATLVRPTQVAAQLVRVDAPIMVVVSLALLAALVDGGASRLEGSLFLLGLLLYVAFTFWQARQELPDVQREFASATPRPRAGAMGIVALLVVGLALLVGGGHLLVEGAVEIAAQLGISQAAIGLTVVAVGTSLPELATSLVAALRGHGDIAVSNVIGSNIFNILGILGLTALVRPLALGGISVIDLAVMVALAFILVLLLAARSRLGRVEGACFVAGFVLYVGWLLAP
ncbi:MAG TPA: calcium/sodium antiporter [Myxococcota bacterium]